MNYSCYPSTESDTSRIDWSTIQEVELVDVLEGDKPRLRTAVKACWTKEELIIRFECEDDHVVATMTEHDAPLYEEDVVEVFIDTSGSGEVYYELEISPRNVVFDAIVHNNLQGSFTADTSWHAEGMRTAVVVGEGGSWSCELQIPFSAVGNVPAPGTVWRWNLYRIDDDQQGERHFWAWSPTGAIQFHVPSRFGMLTFEG
ncbi:carbohydrate-binding family 9-like protein [Cohnella sp. WQ 127256]|uniref:carbohydrate-binding family 9-like protein n=1 Tax=Cohnella sp. WQ 127256 TaxID=2938790 RepID=UPI002117DA97|nr:carbohydrate-binding family 9-like protein [Cohnella sp. WQ 127256]